MIVSQPNYYSSPNHEKSLGMVELPVSGRWSHPRSGRVTGDVPSSGRYFGTPAPGSGYSLKIVNDYISKLGLDDHEDHHDLIVGFGVLVSKRASLFGRSPYLPDVEFCAKLFGLGEDANPDLVEFRKMFFKGCAHSYIIQRQIADAVPDSTLRMNINQLSSVQDRLSLFKL